MKISKKGEWMELTIPSKWNNYTIEQLLKTDIGVPKTMLHQFRMEKTIKINGEQLPWSHPLSTGDRLHMRLFIDEDYGVIPEYHELQVLYEDDHVMVVNKPAGIDTHPTMDGQTGTLANAVAYHFLTNGEQLKVRHIHRLDKNTTGAVIFAKNKLSSSILDRALESREISRTYIALVHGIIKQKKGRIDAPIGRDRHHATRRRVSPTGQHAVTNYKVLDILLKHKQTFIELTLETGRTHQIRVHMSHLGYPLVGDTLYGGEETISRQALHAVKVSFSHPITNERIHCFAEPLDQPPLFPPYNH
ncbi:RluA family pseudouridine synthase [Bacillus timonensis]|nr:RluA family pseudouridine synthase [Bacillus timonensis]